MEYKREDFDIEESELSTHIGWFYIDSNYGWLLPSGLLVEKSYSDIENKHLSYFPTKQEAEEAITKFLAKQNGITNQEIIVFLEKVKINLEEWGQYANTYFQQKHDLNGDIKEIDDFIEKLKEEKEGM